MTTPVLAVEDLRYRYAGATTPAVDGMTFTLAPGEVLGILGPSGAGKTTLQRAVIGLLDGWEGRIDVLGRPRREWGPELHDRIGVAFELPVGYPRFTVREDLAHFARLHRVPSEDPVTVLARVGLDDEADALVGSLSKGQRIRLNLARALLHRPDVLFLDEPTSGLDPVNVEAVRGIIRSERDRGRSIVLTTHDMGTADVVCDRVAFVVDGRIAACGSPRDLRLAAVAERRVVVEHRDDDGRVTTRSFPLGVDDADLAALLASPGVETVHTTEASLADVFVAVTGRSL